MNNSSIENDQLVSIITPVLNGVKYLETCVESVLSQSYPNIEQIFVDGGSTDGTLDMLADYQARYPDRIRFVSEPDKGVGEALNKGMAIAKGAIFGWLDSDDIYEPDAIQTVADFFRSNPDAYFVFGEGNIIDEQGELVGPFETRDFDLKDVINNRCYILLISSFYRRELIEKVGPFNTLGNYDDFIVRVGKAFHVYRIRNVLSSWRLHADNISFSRDAGKTQTVKRRFKEDYHLCRRHGGSILAPRCRRYFIFIVLDKLRLYYFVNFTILARLQRYAVIARVLRFLGA